MFYLCFTVNMKKLLLLLLITISLPVHAQVPPGMPGSFETSQLPPLQRPQRKVLKGWVKENTNNDGSKTTSFMTDEEIIGTEPDSKEVSTSNNAGNDSFNRVLGKELQIQNKLPEVEIETSISVPDDAENWTEEQARENLFKNVVYKKDLSGFSRKDPYYKENMLAIKSGESLIDDRLLVMFSDNTYAVRILTDELYDKAFHYTESGKLEKIVYYNYPEHIYNLETHLKATVENSIFPYTESYYMVSDGSLAATGISTKKIGYLFNVDKSLNCYWKDNKGYSPDGTLFMTKKTIKF